MNAYFMGVRYEQNSTLCICGYRFKKGTGRVDLLG